MRLLLFLSVLVTVLLYSCGGQCLPVDAPEGEYFEITTVSGEVYFTSCYSGDMKFTDVMGIQRDLETQKVVSVSGPIKVDKETAIQYQIMHQQYSTTDHYPRDGFKSKYDTSNTKATGTDFPMEKEPIPTIK